VEYARFLERIKEKAGTGAGMILVHNGVVRDRDRDGRLVSGIVVTADRGRLDAVLEEARRLPGVLAVEVEICEGALSVGEDLMLLGVAGDIREHVIGALTWTLNRIKTEVTRKKEYFL